LAAALEPTAGDGRAYEVTLIQAGETLHGWLFPPSVLRDSVPLWEGVTSLVDHRRYMEHPSVRDVVGTIGNVWFENGALWGEYRVLDSAEWLTRMLDQIIADREAGLPVPRVGLSADMLVKAHREGERYIAEKIGKVLSVDVVFDPAAGGAFERVLNSVLATNENKRGGDQMSDEMVAVSDNEEAGARWEEMERVQCAHLLRASLNASGLPGAMKEEIRGRYEGRIFTVEELNEAIKGQERLLAKLVEDEVIKGVGEPIHPIVGGMWDSLDRIQLAADRLFGVVIPEVHSDIPRLSGIRELYLLLTGDWDFYGRFFRDRVQLANVTTTTMTSVVKNALNKALLAAYNARPKWWAPIAYEEEFPTLNDITWIKTGGIGDLPTVSEGAAYTELSWSDNEETTSFVKKGGYIGITLEVIDRDDVGAVRRIPRELGQAAWRTLSQLVSNLFTSNSGTGPVLSDGYNLFDATNHKNLRTAALSAPEWDAVIQAVYKQTEPTSNKRLGVRPKYLLVPIELEKTALQIMLSEGEPATANNEANVRRGSAEVIVVPEWTDANDWAAACDPSEVEGVCIGHRFGKEPELFIADEPAIGSMFTNDEMRIKCRFIVAVGIGDYRALHKNNVA
jgi:hypothetical protein